MGPKSGENSFHLHVGQKAVISLHLIVSSRSMVVPYQKKRLFLTAATVGVLAGRRRL